MKLLRTTALSAALMTAAVRRSQVRLMLGVGVGAADGAGAGPQSGSQRER